MANNGARQGGGGGNGQMNEHVEFKVKVRDLKFWREKHCTLERLANLTLFQLNF